MQRDLACPITCFHAIFGGGKLRKLIQFSQFLELQGDTNADFRFFMLVYDFAMGAWYFWRAVVSLHGATEGCDLWVFPLFDYSDFVF